MACSECPRGPWPGLNSECSTSLVPHDDPVKGKCVCFSSCTGDKPETWSTYKPCSRFLTTWTHDQIDSRSPVYAIRSPCTCHHAFVRLPFNLPWCLILGKWGPSFLPGTNTGACKDFSSCHGYLWGPRQEEVGERPEELVLWDRAQCFSPASCVALGLSQSSLVLYNPSRVSPICYHL